MKPEKKTREMSAAKLADIFRRVAALLDEEAESNLTVTIMRGKSYTKIRGYDNGGGISLTISGRGTAV